MRSIARSSRQTLQFVYDVGAALATLHRILAPGGVLLATVPGITKISRIEDEEFGEWWHYTGRSFRRLAEQAFGSEAVEVQTFGNVLAASGFLYGLAESDLRPGGDRRPRPALRGRHRPPRREALAAPENALGRRGELSVDPTREPLLDGCQPVLERVEPALKTNDVGLAETAASTA